MNIYSPYVCVLMHKRPPFQHFNLFETSPLKIVIGPSPFFVDTGTITSEVCVHIYGVWPYSCFFWPNNLLHICFVLLHNIVYNVLSDNKNCWKTIVGKKLHSWPLFTTHSERHITSNANCYSYNRIFHSMPCCYAHVNEYLYAQQ